MQRKADQIKAEIRNRVKKKLIVVIADRRAKGRISAPRRIERQVYDATPPTAGSAAQRQASFVSGFASAGGEGGGSAAQEMSLEDEAEKQLKEYEKELYADAAIGVIAIPLTDVLQWWGNLGEKKRERFGDLREVALSVCAIMAGSANLENGFSSSADIITRHRSTLADHNSEMVMVLNHAFRNGFNATPDEIKVLDDLQMKEAIPQRFRDPSLLALWRDLDCGGIEDPNGFENLAAMAHWTSVGELALSMTDDAMDRTFLEEDGIDDDLAVFRRARSDLFSGLGAGSVDLVDQHDEMAQQVYQEGQRQAPLHPRGNAEGGLMEEQHQQQQQQQAGCAFAALAAAAAAAQLG